jgi:hypothetical protein
MADYQLTETDVVIRTSDGASIPNDPENKDRAEYKESRAAWLKAGKPIAEFEASFAAPALASVKAQLKAQIDSAAEGQRSRYITAGSGMALVYEAKRTEVSRWRSLGDPINPGADAFPWAADRAERLDKKIADVLAEWAAQADAWLRVGIALESIREAANEDVQAATTTEEAQAVFAAIIWPTP